MNTNTAKTSPTVAFLTHVCAVIVAGYFLYAAWDKLLDPRQFAVDIKNYRILPEAWVNLPALFMPWLEVFSAIALLIPKTRRAGAVLIAGMLLMFIGMVGYSAIYMGLDISCGCTGKNSAPAGWLTIGRNTLLLLGTAGAVFLPVWYDRLRRRRQGMAFDANTAVQQPAYAVSSDRPSRGG